MIDLDMDALDALQALCDAATPGPWESICEDDEITLPDGSSDTIEVSFVRAQASERSSQVIAYDTVFNDAEFAMPATTIAPGGDAAIEKHRADYPVDDLMGRMAACGGLVARNV